MNLRSLLLTIGVVIALFAPLFGQEDLKAGDPETRKLLEQGSKAFLVGDYKQAIPPYQKALDREKANRTLKRIDLARHGR